MAASTDTLERELANTIQTITELVPDDDSFHEELYRGLAGVSWYADDGGHVTLSWKRAEELVNAARERHGRGPLTLAQTGGESEITDRIARAFEGTGWSSRPRDTGRHD